MRDMIHLAVLFIIAATTYLFAGLIAQLLPFHPIVSFLVCLPVGFVLAGMFLLFVSGVMLRIVGEGPDFERPVVHDLDIPLERAAAVELRSMTPLGRTVLGRPVSRRAIATRNSTGSTTSCVPSSRSLTIPYNGRMETADNPFSKMQRAVYDGLAPHWGAYRHHNDNPDYWYVLMAPLKAMQTAGKLALDFGSGQGRNVLNMLHMSDVERADGCDISPLNHAVARERLKDHAGRFNLYTVNGVELNGVDGGTYAFVCSTLVFQHVCVHSIRTSIMKDIHRVMVQGGIFSFQMGFGKCKMPTVAYGEDRFDAKDTNGALDVAVVDPAPLVSDLKSIGFCDVEYEIKKPWDCTHESWIYARARK